MALKEIYQRSMDCVIAGTLTKDELWEIFEEQLEHKELSITILKKEVRGLNDRNKVLLRNAREGHKLYKQLYPNESDENEKNIIV